MVDASAVVDALVRVPAPEDLVRTVSGAAMIHVPEHFHIEVISAIRGMHRGDLIDERIARQGLDQLRRLRVLRYPVQDLERGIWALRHNLTAYDAAYLALARTLDLPLLSTDGALAAAARADGRLVDLG